ncbi:MAG: penicillin-binding protein, partial [Oxalobacteraceae bacterium]
MEDMTVSPGAHDFGPVRAAMQRYVDAEVLPGVSYAVLEGRALVDLQCVGWADREHDVP